MRCIIARWLLRLALRLDPYDPFVGLLAVDVDRGMRGRWLLIAAFENGGQARAAQSYLLSQPYAAAAKWQSLIARPAVAKNGAMNGATEARK